MNDMNTPVKVVRRLKREGLVPQGDAIRLVTTRKRKDVTLRWTAENAVTGEPYRVGGTAAIIPMARHHWNREDRDGWVILSPGELLEPLRTGGGWDMDGIARKRAPRELRALRERLRCLPDRDRARRHPQDRVLRMPFHPVHPRGACGHRRALSRSRALGERAGMGC